MRLLPVCLVLTACEPAGPGAESIALALDSAEVVESIDTTSTAQDPPAPAVMIDPDLVGLRAPVKNWFLSRSDRHVVRVACRARASTACWQMHELGDGERRLRFTPPGFETAEHMDEFCTRTAGEAFCDTPLVVSFDGAPVEYVPATHRFAFRGEPVATDWPTAKTPWIAIDRDGDGAITSGLELFGDATAKNGFAALAALDANADGVIDRADPDFAKLLLWADANADRESTPDELRPLSAAIVAIPLANRLDVRCTDGNCEGERGTAQLPGGRTGAVIDIYLAER